MASLEEVCQWALRFQKKKKTPWFSLVLSASDLWISCEFSATASVASLPAGCQAACCDGIGLILRNYKQAPNQMLSSVGCLALSVYFQEWNSNSQLGAHYLNTGAYGRQFSFKAP